MDAFLGEVIDCSVLETYILAPTAKPSTSTSLRPQVSSQTYGAGGSDRGPLGYPARLHLCELAKNLRPDSLQFLLHSAPLGQP